jgi:hypothetical protein
MAGFTVNDAGIRATIDAGARAVLLPRLRAVEARAKVYCPVRDGGLRSSIHIVGPQRVTPPTRWEGYVVADKVYAPAIHEGRGSRWAPPSWSRRGPGPRRFLKNALAAARGR